MHRLFDNRNLKRHIIDSMDPDRWGEILLSENYEIVYKGYFGGFIFWIDSNDTHNPVKRIIAMGIARLTEYFGSIFPNNKMYSPFCGIIARKIDLNVGL